MTSLNLFSLSFVLLLPLFHSTPDVVTLSSGRTIPHSALPPHLSHLSSHQAAFLLYDLSSSHHLTGHYLSLDLHAETRLIRTVRKAPRLIRHFNATVFNTSRILTLYVRSGPKLTYIHNAAGTVFHIWTGKLSLVSLNHRAHYGVLINDGSPLPPSLLTTSSSDSTTPHTANLARRKETSGCGKKDDVRYFELNIEWDKTICDRYGDASSVLGFIDLIMIEDAIIAFKSISCLEPYISTYYDWCEGSFPKFSKNVTNGFDTLYRFRRNSYPYSRSYPVDASIFITGWKDKTPAKGASFQSSACIPSVAYAWVEGMNHFSFIKQLAHLVGATDAVSGVMSGASDPTFRKSSINQIQSFIKKQGMCLTTEGEGGPFRLQDPHRLARKCSSGFKRGLMLSCNTLVHENFVSSLLNLTISLSQQFGGFVLAIDSTAPYKMITVDRLLTTDGLVDDFYRGYQNNIEYKVDTSKYREILPISEMPMPETSDTCCGQPLWFGLRLSILKDGDSPDNALSFSGYNKYPVDKNIKCVTQGEFCPGGSKVRPMTKNRKCPKCIS